MPPTTTAKRTLLDSCFVREEWFCSSFCLSLNQNLVKMLYDPLIAVFYSFVNRSQLIQRCWLARTGPSWSNSSQVSASHFSPCRRSIQSNSSSISWGTAAVSFVWSNTVLKRSCSPEIQETKVNTVEPLFLHHPKNPGKVVLKEGQSMFNTWKCEGKGFRWRKRKQS